MKLVQINSVVNTGSTGRIAEEIGEKAMQSNWDSYIAYGRYGNESHSCVIKIGKSLDVLYHVFQTRVFDKHGFSSKSTTEKFIKELRNIKPDIIHLHNIHGYYLNIELLCEYLAQENIPVIWTLHDCWAFTGHCAYFDFAGCDKWKEQCYHCPEKKAYPASLFLDNSESNFLRKKEAFTSVSNLTIITPSKWLAELVKGSFLSCHEISVINNGIDLSVFKPTESDLRKKYELEDKFVVLGVASVWSRRKGMDDFVKLSKRVEDSIQIVLIGVNAKQAKAIPKDIICIPKTENTKQLAEFYTLADIFMNPTYEDNFPTTNLEAMACGTPVVTYNTGGSVESVTKDTGVIVEKGDVSGLVETITQMSQVDMNIYNEACVARARKMYNKDDRYEEYIELYDRILKTKSTT